MAPLIVMSPLPPDVPVLTDALVLALPLPVVMVTSLELSAVNNAAGVRLPVEPTMKSLGSSSQVPDLPAAAVVLTCAPSAICSLEADVSMKPPSPPRLPPWALRLPETSVLLLGLARSAITSMRPPCPALPGAALALMLPVF